MSKNKKNKPVNKTEEVNPDEEITHIITEEDLVNNPELANEGVEVGEEVLLPILSNEVPVKRTVPTDRPCWMDVSIWNELDDDQKIEVCEGKSLSNIK